MADATRELSDFAGGARVLVVEDEEDTLDALSEVLVALGYEVETARNGAEAMVRMRTSTPDLVLLDLSMPVMNGWDFHSRMRRDPDFCETPVVAVTAIAQPRRSIFDAYLRKPFELDTLAFAVERALHAA